MKQHADLSWGLLCNLRRTSQSSAKTDIAITEETAQWADSELVRRALVEAKARLKAITVLG